MWLETFQQVVRVPLLAGLLAGMALAAQGAEISDEAGFFSQEAIRAAEREIAAIKSDTGKELRIETFATVPEGKAGQVRQMQGEARDRFFDDWARQRAQRAHVTGIYVLICKDPGHVHVEVDRPTRTHGFGTAQRNELRDQFLLGFRHKKFDQGLADGVDYVGKTLKATSPAATGNPTHADDARPARRHPGALPFGGQPANGGGMGWFGWVIVAVVIVMGIRLIGGLFGGGGGGYGGGYGPGGGGMMGGFLSGLFGAVAGNWLYHSFLGNTAFGSDSSAFGSGHDGTDSSGNDGAGSDFEGSGGDFDDAAGGGGDFGGGDFGGGDFGGGDFGGGDFGGGDFGGGGDF